MTDLKKNPHCRIYENKKPMIDDCVAFKATSITDVGIYVNLIEYNTPGFIILSEITKRRMRSVAQFIRIGKEDYAMVTNYDDEYIDLSRKRVTDEDRQRCIEKYKRYKKIYSILKHIADTNNIELESLLNATIWHLDRYFKSLRNGDNKELSDDLKQKYLAMNGYNGFKMIGAGNRHIFNTFEFNKIKPLDDTQHIPNISKIQELLLTDIVRVFEPQKKIVRSEISVTCFTYEGIDAIKYSLNQGLKLSTDSIKININLVTSPRYSVHTETTDTEKAMELIHNANKAINNAIIIRKGEFMIISEPRVC